MNSKVLKKCFLIVVLLFLFNLELEAQFFEEDQNYFSYDTNNPFGPDNWEGLCQNGQKQSPLRFETGSIKLINPSPTQLRLKITGGYDKTPSQIRVINNGFGVYFEFTYDPSVQVPRIVFGPLGNRFYKFHSFSYHYTGDHQSNSKAKTCDLELQFLHFKEQYGTFQNAKDKPDGLAVISICHNTLNTSPPKFYHPNLLLAVPMVHDIFSKTILTGNALFTYADALGLSQIDPTPNHYFYEGSLTVPPCTESVKWFVLKDVFKIDPIDLDIFKSVNTIDNLPVRNNRATQDINGRSVINYV